MRMLHNLLTKVLAQVTCVRLTYGRSSILTAFLDPKIYNIKMIFICSKLTIGTPEQFAKSAHSYFQYIFLSFVVFIVDLTFGNY